VPELPYPGGVVDGGGRLILGGCYATDLARHFGTPLYVVDEGVLRSRCRAYAGAFAAGFPQSRVAYAAKAFLTADMCRLVEAEGLWLDVNSAGEIAMALSAGFPPARMLFHGNNKTPAEVRLAIESRVARIIVDSLWELELVARLAAQAGRTAHILLRLAPGVRADTHAYVQTGLADGKFGLAIAGKNGTCAAEVAAAMAIASPHLRFYGVHVHVGSQLLDLRPLREAARRAVRFAASISERCGWRLEELDLGGGLGAPYTSETPPAITALAAALARVVKAECRAAGIPLPAVLVEPGRSIVAEAGTTLYTVGGTKVTPHGPAFLSVNGGMGDNPRVALYGARYRVVVADRVTAPPARAYHVVGRYCESGDAIAFDCPLPQVRAGDILAVFATGAYHHAMASTYNLVPRPAIVVVDNGWARLSVRRESLDDLLRREVGPGEAQAVCLGPAGAHAGAVAAEVAATGEEETSSLVH